MGMGERVTSGGGRGGNDSLLRLGMGELVTSGDGRGGNDSLLLVRIGEERCGISSFSVLVAEMEMLSETVNYWTSE